VHPLTTRHTFTTGDCNWPTPPTPDPPTAYRLPPLPLSPSPGCPLQFVISCFHNSGSSRWHGRASCYAKTLFKLTQITAITGDVFCPNLSDYRTGGSDTAFRQIGVFGILYFSIGNARTCQLDF